MRVAYVRGENNDAEMQADIAAVEKVRCDRMVIDSVSGQLREAPGTLASLVGRMKSGDHLVVTRLDQLAGSTHRLLELLADLIERGISIETLAGEFDIGQPETARIIRALCDFEKRAREDRRLGRGFHAEPVPGRPFRLSPDAVAEARELIEVKGRPVSEVARALGVSRSTLYRSLKRF